MRVLVGSLSLELSETQLSDPNCLSLLSQVADNLNSVNSSSSLGLDAVIPSTLVATPTGNVQIQHLKNGDVVKSQDGLDLVIDEVVHFVLNPSSVQRPVLVSNFVSSPIVITYGAKVFTNRLVPVRYLNPSNVSTHGLCHLVNLKLVGGSSFVSMHGLGVRSL